MESLSELWMSAIVANGLGVMIDIEARGHTELVHHFCLKVELTSARRCLIFNWYGLAITLAHPSGEEGGILFVPTCLQQCLGGGGVSTLF